MAILALLIWAVGGTISAQSPEDAGMIQEIKPTASVLNVGKGYRVLLSVIVIGLDGNEDQSLASTVNITWSASDGELEVQNDTTRAIYTAPRLLGTLTVTASAGSACVGDATECNATFTINVRTIHGPSPYNPPGEIPTALVDAEGIQYAVFTPEEGGTFNGDEFWVSASKGVVPSGEYIGVRMFEDGAASNAGMSHLDYAFSGNQYKISVVDAEGIPIASYTLHGRVEVCILMPDELLPSISSTVVVTINTDGTLTTTSLRWQITRSSYYSCGYTGKLPATVAVGIPGTPPEMLPATGGSTPSSPFGLAWAFLLGIALMSTGAFTFAMRMQRHRSR